MKHIQTAPKTAEKDSANKKTPASRDNPRESKTREQKLKVALVFGGRSPEHEVSILSARNIAQALDKKRYDVLLLGISKQGTWYQLRSDMIPHNLKTLSDDALPPLFSQILWSQQNGIPWIYRMEDQQNLSVNVAFPILHGLNGEDGAIQGFFKTLSLPFAGCDVLGSSICMDKEIAKRLMLQAGVPCTPYRVLRPQTSLSYSELTQLFGSPFFIKPARQGSSVGVHKINSESEFATKLEDAFRYDNKVLAEKAILGRELEVSVMGHNLSPKASRVGEVRSQHDFYSYEAKYVDENGAQLFSVADIPSELEKQIQAVAEKAYQVLDCDGFARVDFLWSEKDGLFLNEINTLPGFTKISMFPKMWESSGIGYTELLSSILDLAMAKAESDQKLLTEFPTALK